MSNEKLAGLTRYSGTTISNSYALESEEFFLARKVESLLATTSTEPGKTEASASSVPRAGGNTCNEIDGSSPVDAGGLTDEQIEAKFAAVYYPPNEPGNELLQRVFPGDLVKVVQSLLVTKAAHPKTPAPLGNLAYSDDRGYYVEWHMGIPAVGTELYSAVGASPATSAKPEPSELALIAHLIGIIFFAGDFKAETANERQLEALLVKTGHRYASWEEIDAATENLAATSASASPAAPKTQHLPAFALYQAVNKLVAHIGMQGEIDSKHELVDAVMGELHKLDGGKVARRVEDLVEKAFMPEDQATRLAVDEYCAIASESATPAAEVAQAGYVNVEDVKALCRDFSSRTGNVYIKDVEAALDGLIEPFAASPAAAVAAPTAPKMTIRDGIWWPEGYCTDPNGHIVAPAGKDVDFKFGYDIGYAEGIAVRRPDAPVAGSQHVPEEVGGVNLARLLRNLEETSYNEGSIDLACRCSDSLTVIKGLLAAAAPAVPVPAAEPQWQMMETAPKDGSTILLYLSAPWSEVEKARWFAPWENWQRDDCDPDPSCDEFSGIGSEVPSHWMPLPAAPSLQQPQEGSQP